MESSQANDLVRGTVFLAKKSLVQFSIIGSFMVAIGLIEAFFYHARANGAALALVGIFVGGHQWLLVLLRSKKASQAPTMRGTIYYILDDDGLIFQTPQSKAELSWSGIVRWKEDAHTFLVFTSPKHALFRKHS